MTNSTQVFGLASTASNSIKCIYVKTTELTFTVHGKFYNVNV